MYLQGAYLFPLKHCGTILSLLVLLAQAGNAQLARKDYQFNFFETPISFSVETDISVPFSGSLSQDNIAAFYTHLNQSNYQPIIEALSQYKQTHQPDDWLFYQLIRKTAQELSPKAENYERYTLYKWFLLQHCGYDVLLTVSNNIILFYVQSDENIYNIPSRISHNKQYVCLNYHDYGRIDFSKTRFTEIALPALAHSSSFSYRVTQLPDFSAKAYEEKDIRFTYRANEYEFRVRLNPQVKSLFANYPVVDYSYYFNIPLSRETYASLIPSLQKTLKGMSRKKGLDYLMHFTRYAFSFEKDSEHFGKEKRMSAEETLLYPYSDCEDRAALFFCLVKEIYDLPMLVLVFPEHVTIAVQFDTPLGRPILYKGKNYYVCEPTPQKKDLRLGELLPQLARQNYEVAYAYQPGSH